MDQSQNDFSTEFILQVGSRRGSTCSIATQTRPNATHPVLSLRSSRICCKHCFLQNDRKCLYCFCCYRIHAKRNSVGSFAHILLVVMLLILLLKYCCCCCFFSVFFLSFVDVEIIFSLQAALNARHLEQQQQQQQLKSLSPSRSSCIFEALPSYKGPLRQ